jgi:integrase
MLRTKAIALVGYYGYARNYEMVGLTWADVRVDQQRGVWITLTRKKCNKEGSREEILIPRISGHRIIPADVFLAYKNSVFQARPQKENRVWRRWANNKWHASALGPNVLRNAPKLVAQYLGLDPKNYKGHSWRPSGASALAAHGGTAAQLQTAGHWRSLSVAQQYIHAGQASRISIAEVLTGPASQEEDQPETAPQLAVAPQPELPEPASKVPKIVFTAPLTNCTINIGRI